MNHQSAREHLDDVLDAYLAAAPNPDHATLTEWVRRYPHYEQELTDFTVARNLMHALPEPVITERDEAEFMNRGRGVIAASFNVAPAAQADAPALPGLIEAGKAQGLRLPDIAKRLRLSAVIVRNLDRRLFAFASLPRTLVEQLADVLQQQTQVIAAYLQLPPTLATGASYRADNAPKLAEAEDFSEAVKGDISMSEDDRSYWLELIEKP